MKKLLVLLPLLFLVLLCFSQSKVLESISMESKLLNTSVKYSVYLPDGFDTSEEQYPVVYLLNGYGGDETNWLQKGHLKEIADKLIKSRRINPMVIVMPDGDDMLYMNKDDGTYPYEDMLITEFIPKVERDYRIKQDKEYRGISGLSMGGAGTLRLALKYHNLFGACAAFSSAIFTEQEMIDNAGPGLDAYIGRAVTSIKGLKGPPRLEGNYKDYDVLNLVKTKDSTLLKQVHIYFDCGDDDFLTLGNTQLRIELKKKNIPHEYRVRDGGHTWNFWVESLPHGLEFISNSMQN